MPVSGIQNTLAFGTRFVEAVWRVKNIYDKFQAIIEYTQSIRKLYTFASICAAGVTSGGSMGTVVLTALSQAFGVDGSALAGQLTSWVDQTFSSLAKDQVRYIVKYIQDNAASIAEMAAFNPMTARIIAAATTGEDIKIIFGLPSPPVLFSGKKKIHFWLPAITIRGVDYVVGWSGNGGVFFDFGLGVENAKAPDLAKCYPHWEAGNYRSVVRIDYWNWYKANKGGEYKPHYHIWEDSTIGQNGHAYF